MEPGSPRRALDGAATSGEMGSTAHRRRYLALRSRPHLDPKAQGPPSAHVYTIVYSRARCRGRIGMDRPVSGWSIECLANQCRRRHAAICVVAENVICLATCSRNSSVSSSVSSEISSGEESHSLPELWSRISFFSCRFRIGLGRSVPTTKSDSVVSRRSRNDAAK